MISRCDLCSSFTIALLHAICHNLPCNKETWLYFCWCKTFVSLTFFSATHIKIKGNGFGSTSILGLHIRTNFCTCHDSYAVMSFAKFYNDLCSNMDDNEMNYSSSLNCNEKNPQCNGIACIRNGPVMAIKPTDPSMKSARLVADKCIVYINRVSHLCDKSWVHAVYPMEYEADFLFCFVLFTLYFSGFSCYAFTWTVLECAMLFIYSHT